MNWHLLLNSVLVSGAATALAVSLGGMVALWSNALPFGGRNLMLACAIVTLALPPFLVTNSWLYLLGETGVWRRWIPFNILSAGGTVWILALMTWPIPMFAVSGALRRLETPQLESDPAVTGWNLIRALLLPLTRTALLQSAVLSFVLALNNFAVPSILQVKVLPAEMWVKFSTTFDSLGTLRQSWPLIVAPMLLLLWFTRREVSWPRVQGPVSSPIFRQQLGALWFCVSGFTAVIVCVLAVGIPLLQLILARHVLAELPGALAAGQHALWNSVLYAAVTSLLCLALSLSTWRWPIGRILWLPFLVPGVLIGIALIGLFNRVPFTWLYQSAGIVIVAYLIRYLGVGWNGMAHSFRMTDPSLADVAKLDGANPWQMFQYVYWPQIAPQIFASGYVVFLLCLWDVESLVLIVPPDGETLALRIFNLLHYGHNSQVDALCLILVAAALAPLLLWAVGRGLVRSWHRYRGPNRMLQHVLHFAVYVIVAVSIFSGCSPAPTLSQSLAKSQLFNSVQVIGSRGVGIGQLNKPRSVAVDAQDNLFVVDMTGRVQKFSPAGEFLLSWQMPQTELGKAKGMCRDREGNIVVVEPHYQRVNHYSADGRLVAQWGERGTNAGQFMMPRAIAVNTKGEIIVSEYREVDRVQIFGPKGAKVIKTFGHLGAGSGEFNRPEGLCVDANDRIYVADACNHRIQVFSSDGKFIRAYGKAGSGKGELSYPYDICVDSAGFQFVCEFGNSRIQVFDANDQPVEIIGRPGGAPAQFSNPWGIALDSAGNLYVADSQNHRVQKLIRHRPLVESQARK